MKITANGPQSVGQVADAFEFGNLFLSPEEYQRESAWDIGQKMLLIDTIFSVFDIPKFYLWRIDTSTLTTYPEGLRKIHYTNSLVSGSPEAPCQEVVEG